MQNSKNQKHGSDPKMSKIQAMFLKMQNSSLGGKICFLLTKLNWFCHAVYQLLYHFFCWFHVPYKRTWLNMRIPEKDEPFSKSILLFKHYSSCLSVYLFIWNHQSWWTSKCTFEYLCFLTSNDNKKAFTDQNRDVSWLSDRSLILSPPPLFLFLSKYLPKQTIR